MPNDNRVALRQAGPVEFVRRTLGENPYDKQVEILNAVANSRRVSVVGCNASGKDWAAARAVLWWVCSHSPSKAIITGPTTRQVDDILWHELRIAYAQAAHALGGRMFRTSRYEIDNNNFALGFSTNSPYNLQGFHSPNLLVVVTEAHAVHQMDMDAIRRLNPARLLMTGNALTAAGAFYDSHHSRRRLYHTIHVAAADTPNVKRGSIVIPGMITPEDVDDHREQWGEESAQYAGAVLAKFPEDLDEIAVPLTFALEAAKKRLQPAGELIIACDVARYGHAMTVVMKRQGPVARIVWRVRGRDTMKTADFLHRYCLDNPVDAIVVDDTGVGGGVVDRLKALRPPRARIVPFLGGAAAVDKDHFANRVSEAWYAMRTRYLQHDLDTDDDPALIAQVSSRKYEYRGLSQIALESKRKNPDRMDEADALAMTFAASRGEFTIWT